jgi:uncharacterized coiled-coil DUF342 family protein
MPSINEMRKSKSSARDLKAFEAQVKTMNQESDETKPTNDLLTRQNTVKELGTHTKKDKQIATMESRIESLNKYADKLHDEIQDHIDTILRLEIEKRDLHVELTDACATNTEPATPESVRS